MLKVTQMISNVQYTGEWPRDVTELSMNVLQKKPTATATIPQSAEIAARILRRITERKLEDVLGDRFGLRKGKRTAGATRMLRITPGRTLDTDEELWVCFTERQKASDRVKWTESMPILKGTDIGAAKED